MVHLRIDKTAFIRSFGAADMTTGTSEGFYLRSDGEFMFGDAGGNNIRWDNVDLTIKGDIEADSLTLLNDATITKTLTMGDATTKGSIVHMVCLH